MKLQAAIDCDTVNEALELMKQIHPYVDIVEIGTMLGLCEGFRVLTIMKEHYPHLKVLCDAKLVDGGYDIARRAFDAGADIVTTIGLTNNETCRGVIKAAHERNKEAMVDMIGVPGLAERAEELDRLGFDYILVHTAHDMSARFGAPLDELKMIRKRVKHAKIGISGGITLEKIPEIVTGNPDWIVVGGALYNAKNPKMVAERMKNAMK